MLIKSVSHQSNDSACNLLGIFNQPFRLVLKANLTLRLLCVEQTRMSETGLLPVKAKTGSPKNAVPAVAGCLSQTVPQIYNM